MRLGTYSTIDCPVGDNSIVEEAKKFLVEKFDGDGRVRLVQNPHDFGPYPSFEIDYPEEIENHETDDCENSSPCIECEAVDKWHAKAQAIEEEYIKKFNDNL